MADHVTSVFELKYFVVFFIFIVAVKVSETYVFKCGAIDQSIMTIVFNLIAHLYSRSFHLIRIARTVPSYQL